MRAAARERYIAYLQQWLAMAWTWDPQWRTRTLVTPATSGCYDGGWTDDNYDDCEGEWRQRRPATTRPRYLLYEQTAEPELHARVRREGLHPEADQYCLVMNAELTTDRLILVCMMDGEHRFEIWPARAEGLPRRTPPRSTDDAGRTMVGALADVMIGDVVRVHGHQMLVRESVTVGSGLAARQVTRWVFQDIPNGGISIVDRFRCCRIPELSSRLTSPPRDGGRP